SDPKRTESALTTIELLCTAEENATRNSFSSQMPSKETYLKAMNKGLVELFSRNSTAAVRVLFFNYLLLGTLDAHEGALDDAAFWREAALRTLGDLAEKHPATRALDDLIDRRRDLQAAQELLSRINGPHALATLESTRRRLEDSPQSRLLSASIYSLRELQAAVRDWSDGEFRAAGIKLENALKAVDEAETQASISLTNYRAWLMDLIAAAADLHNVSRRMQQIIDELPDEPDEQVRTTHHRLLDGTMRLLGESYASNLRLWSYTYEAFLAAYTDRTVRRSARLSRFNELFRSMFIDRHPAYPLYRHWYELTERAPEFPAPPTDEPTPRLTDAEDSDLEAIGEPAYDAGQVASRGRRRRSVPGLPLVAVWTVVALAVRVGV